MLITLESFDDGCCSKSLFGPKYGQNMNKECHNTISSNWWYDHLSGVLVAGGWWLVGDVLGNISIRHPLQCQIMPLSKHKYSALLHYIILSTTLHVATWHVSDVPPFLQSQLELINFDIDTVMSDALKALFSALTESITDPQWIGIKKHYLCIYIESGKAVCEPFMNNQLVKIFKMPVSE